jgi:microcystin degradation protein MlrC
VNDLGLAVLLDCGDDSSVSVIVTENRLQPLDTEIWRHIGIQTERLDALVVKSKNHFRADDEPIASEVVLVNTPGLGAVDPNRFEFSEIDRPKYPLEEVLAGAHPDQD